MKLREKTWKEASEVTRKKTWKEAAEITRKKKREAVRKEYSGLIRWLLDNGRIDDVRNAASSDEEFDRLYLEMERSLQNQLKASSRDGSDYETWTRRVGIFSLLASWILNG